MEKLKEAGVALPVGFNETSVVAPDWSGIHQRHSNFEYFERESIAPGYGREYIIMKSCFQQKHIPMNMRVDEEDTRLHLKLAQLVESISRGQRDVLGEVLFLAMKSAKKLFELKTHEIPPLPIPQSGKDLRRQFVSNKFSLLNTIPHPSVCF